MSEERTNRSRTHMVTLLVAGFLGLCLPAFLNLRQGDGFFTAVWILSFLLLTGRTRGRRDTLIIGGVFLAGYCLRYLIAVSFELMYAPVFLLVGLILFGIFWGYSRLIRKWNRIWTTLAFPLLWMAAYLLAMLARFPSLLRVDSLFADMNVLLQTENLLTSFGVSFALLWIFALIAFAVENRKLSPALLGAALFFVLLTVGTVILYPNMTGYETVRVAMATGPYGGDYLDYTAMPVERYLDSMRSCAADAAGQGAEILVFNEETYEIDDVEEEAFLAECCRVAGEYRMHMLVGLDLRDTDGSEGGKSVNKVCWIDQDGALLGSYIKSRTIPMLESDYVSGNDGIPSHTVTVGDRQLRVSYLICYDSNFPLYVSGMAEDTDILFLPSWDWPAVTKLHEDLCRTLAIENRVSVVKPTYDGISVAVRPDGTVIGSFEADEIGYEQVRVMEIPISGTSGAVAEYPVHEPYIHRIIAVEIMSILVCLILLYGNRRERLKKRPRNRLFSGAVAACIFALAADAVSWILDGSERLESILFVSTIISMGMIFVLDGVLMYYITEYVREKKPVSSVLPRIYIVFSVLIIIAIVALSESGQLFTFENGAYRDGPLYPAYIIVSLLCTVLCLLSNLTRFKDLNSHERYAAISYIVLPWIAACINLADETFSYTYPATTLSLLVMYALIQSESRDRLEQEGIVSSYHAQHDALTGLLNRMAYDEKLKQLSGADGTLSAVFTDMNGLKITNDTYGHEAGDRMLIRYAELMCRYFRKEEIYRISGDEFTILLPNIGEETLRARVEGFRKALNEDEIPLASVGVASGSSRDANELIREAEAGMYADKAELYRIHPELKKR